MASTTITGPRDMRDALDIAEKPAFVVVHPLDDEPERKCSADGLGTIRMSGTVRASLIALRLYLIVVLGLAAFRLVAAVGLFGHHVN